MQTRNEMIAELRRVVGDEHGYSEAIRWANDVYDRIAEVAIHELRIRCEEQAKVIAALSKPDCRICRICGYYAELRCLRDYDDSIKDASCADGVKAYIEARVKERMGAMEKAKEEQR